MNIEESDLDELAPQQGCGSILAKARMQQQRTIEEIADKLNLSVSQIKAIELDNADGMPGPTYVRGYIRNYANLLGIDSNEVLEHYHNPEWKQKNTWSDVPSEITYSRPRSKSFFSTTRIIALLVCLASLLFLLYTGIIPNSLFDNKKIIVAEQTATETNITESQSAESDNTESASLESSTVATAPSSTSESYADTEADTAQDTPAITEVIDSATANKLKLQFTDTSWVDIRDADGERLAYKTYVSGDELVVGSDTKLTVFIGTAAGVTVEYNNAPFDLSDYREGVYAKFVVGE